MPPYGQPRPLRLQVNGAPAEMTWLRRSEPFIVDPLGLAGRFERPRFRFGLPLAAVGDPALLHLSLREPSGRPIAPSQDIWVSAAPVPQPPEMLRQRVHGPGDAAGFDRTGCTIAHLLARVLERRVPGGFASFGTVLDWGCGCARVGRYLLPALPGRYVGVDPDAGAIGWCRANLPGGRFEVISTDPPLPFATGGVDCVIGVSVFTHSDGGPPAALAG
ncbi:hypothetical protein GCM10011504_34480 [Siccirubricoccus deserti]|uniref:Class I SAM-dependent methyltransferase n=1 Tax=Siccirubricoccus deserti TaxID=2013562 RepID=A0A9X0UEH0_9PROT|nr:class I SAM-dependent methyltransferase [Siccirubricoccus deserti]MBC4017844.1 class I SAM-dependent methyltransferase [Siccirubricoccus deserti]GGC53245.1 hypothetical protein GCM10011504_34480 [Siccirubricoccus deserti]